MLTLKSFTDAVINALSGRTIAPIVREAGLPGTVITHLKQRHDPSLTRAAHIADAVGLELCVRRKGETIDKRILRVAVEDMRKPIHGQLGSGVGYKPS